MFPVRNGSKIYVFFFRLTLISGRPSYSYTVDFGHLELTIKRDDNLKKTGTLRSRGLRVNALRFHCVILHFCILTSY